MAKRPAQRIRTAARTFLHGPSAGFSSSSLILPPYGSKELLMQPAAPRATIAQARHAERYEFVDEVARTFAEARNSTNGHVVYAVDLGRQIGYPLA